MHERARTRPARRSRSRRVPPGSLPDVPRADPAAPSAPNPHPSPSRHPQQPLPNRDRLMNSEIKSERSKTTQTSLNAQDQATPADTTPTKSRSNSRDVAHDHQPPPPIPTPRDGTRLPR